jgi:hypothetical protein
MNTKIYNLNDMPLSDRNSTYGGNSGDKEGILINQEYWLVKYPKNVKNLQNIGTLSYSTSPLSEYIGSQIYHLLGYPVHETLLGIRNNKLVVACKDFCDDTHRLIEFRQLKNTYNEELSKALDQTLQSTGSDHFTNLPAIQIHLSHNPAIKNIPKIKERFWDCLIVDGWINNNDRNNGNWGILRSKSGDTIAPIYDNGSSFWPNVSEEKLQRELEDQRLLVDTAVHGVTAYSLDGIHNAHFSDILQQDIPELHQAIERVVPMILQKLPDCKELIEGIPEQSGEFQIISSARKEVYEQSLQLCADLLLKPTLQRVQENREIKTESVERDYDLER